MKSTEFTGSNRPVAEPFLASELARYGDYDWQYFETEPQPDDDATQAIEPDAFVVAVDGVALALVGSTRDVWDQHVYGQRFASSIEATVTPQLAGLTVNDAQLSTSGIVNAMYERYAEQQTRDSDGYYLAG